MKPPIELHDHPEMRRAQLDFLNKCEKKVMEFCECCKERWWDLKLNEEDVCKRCLNQRNDPKNGIALMSSDNNMDPFPPEVPSNLPTLTYIEESLIAKVQVVMKCSL